jgi:hypothetical protein
MTFSSVKVVGDPGAGQRVGGARVAEATRESACGGAESETARACPETGAQAAAKPTHCVAAAKPASAAVTASSASAVRRRHTYRSGG